MRPLWQLVVSVLGSSESQAAAPAGETEQILDRWVSARLHHTASAVTDALDGREPARAAGELAALVGDLVAWYQPWRPGAGRELLEPLVLLLAPFLPHLAEAIHREVTGRPRQSLHLQAWPALDPAWEDAALLLNMARVQRLTELGVRARMDAGVDPQQLLPGALVGSLTGASWRSEELQPFSGLLAGALRVAQVKFSADAASHVEWRLALNPERPVQRDVPQAAIEAALAGLGASEAANMAAQLRTGISVGLEVSGLAITLLPDEVSISVHAQAGQAAAAEADHLVILAVG
jgi:isoleucyl-tRNA synthetase